MVGRFASRICGSSDLYAGSGKGPECSINFVACHDGFTLNDLVSYARKHNEPNGEGNRDGADENFSANYGAEGESSDRAVEIVRERQIRNFILTLAISRGVPMLLAGDEFRRTQRGNNNAYCQDNASSWVDWSLSTRHHHLVSFVQFAFAFRRRHPILRREAFYTEREIQWFDSAGHTPAWNDPGQKRLACRIRDHDSDLFVMFNADDAPASFVVPTLAGSGRWALAVDTTEPVPTTIDHANGIRPVDGGVYALASRSSAILEVRPRNDREEVGGP
jgi:glycogen operon protein